MKVPLLAFILVFLTCEYSSAQTTKVLVFNSVLPKELNSSEVIRQNHVTKEMVYRYKRKDKNSDSVLAEVNYYDSMGKIQERDKLSKDGKQPIEITSYYYFDSLLQKKVTSWIDLSGGIEYIFTLYEYDSAGNKVYLKEYRSKSQDIDTSYTSLEERYEYDFNKRMIRRFQKEDKHDILLRNTYEYNNNYLQKIKVYDYDEKWEYSYVYEYSYNENLLVENKYLVNAYGKKLETELYYTESHQLIKGLYYTNEFITFSDHTTSEFEYTNGLLNKEYTRLSSGERAYFKHIYLKNQ